MSDVALRPEPNALLMRASNTVVAVLREYLGRGPTRARAHLSENVLIVVTEDNLTKAERKLISSGEGETVRDLRRRFQTTMRADLVAAIEELTGRRVAAFLSDHDPETDKAAEIFILDGAPERPFS